MGANPHLLPCLRYESLLFIDVDVRETGPQASGDSPVSAFCLTIRVVAVHRCVVYCCVFFSVDSGKMSSGHHAGISQCFAHTPSPLPHHLLNW